MLYDVMFPSRPGRRDQCVRCVEAHNRNLAARIAWRNAGNSPCPIVKLIEQSDLQDHLTFDGVHVYVSTTHRRREPPPKKGEG